jgi:hypothetical protein
LEKGAKVIKEFKDTLPKAHKKILELLQIPESQYWP